MEIPITITFKGNETQLHKELFGLGEEVTDPESLRLFPQERQLWKVNDGINIAVGIKLTPKQERRKAVESIEFEAIDYNFILFFAEIAILGKHAMDVANLIIDTAERLKCTVKIHGKQVKTKEELYKALDELIKTKNDDDIININ